MHEYLLFLLICCSFLVDRNHPQTGFLSASNGDFKKDKNDNLLTVAEHFHQYFLISSPPHFEVDKASISFGKIRKPGHRDESDLSKVTVQVSS